MFWPVWHPRPLLCMQASLVASWWLCAPTCSHPHTCCVHTHLSSPWHYRLPGICGHLLSGICGHFLIYRHFDPSVQMGWSHSCHLGKQESSHVTGSSYLLYFLRSPSSPVHLWSHDESYALSGSNPIRQLVNWPGESLLLPGLVDGSSADSWALCPLNWGCVRVLHMPWLVCFSVHSLPLSFCGDWPLIT